MHDITRLSSPCSPVSPAPSPCRPDLAPRPHPARSASYSAAPARPLFLFPDCQVASVKLLVCLGAYLAPGFYPDDKSVTVNAYTK